MLMIPKTDSHTIPKHFIALLLFYVNLQAISICLCYKTNPVSSCSAVIFFKRGSENLKRLVPSSVEQWKGKNNIIWVFLYIMNSVSFTLSKYGLKFLNPKCNDLGENFILCQTFTKCIHFGQNNTTLKIFLIQNYKTLICSWNRNFFLTYINGNKQNLKMDTKSISTTVNNMKYLNIATNKKLVIGKKKNAGTQ